MARGQVLRIVSTDQGSLKTFAAFSKQTDNSLLACGNAGGKFVSMFEKIRTPAGR